MAFFWGIKIVFVFVFYVFPHTSTQLVMYGNISEQYKLQWSFFKKSFLLCSIAIDLDIFDFRIYYL